MKHWTLLVLCPLLGFAQPSADYWQQAVHYRMQVELDPSKHLLTGAQQLVYYNHSPDTLDKLYYHLYFNAFQPNSMMDERSRALPDPDKRVGDRIAGLRPKEQGYQKILGLKANGVACNYQSEQTILRVLLPQPLLPGDSVLMEMDFEAQVPVQIRRSGRDNAEGIDYTMTQWYPKIAAYDRHGWHPDPYVAREFYAPFGRFEVDITLPREYKLAATGLLQDFEQFWQEESFEDDRRRYAYLPGKAKKRTWRWHADQVHDFAWAADPDYVHTQMDYDEDLSLHFFYLPEYQETWQALGPYARQFFRFMNAQVGPYPYPQYSAIQGGDGGMEYPMCTMMKGTGSLPGLIGLYAHEGAHSWFQGVLGINEFRFPWMDEGFTNWSDAEATNQMRKEPLLNPHQGALSNHLFLASRPEEWEPLSTPADYYERNRSYGINAYSRGELFLVQLEYITGRDNLDRALQKFFRDWQFKHPEPLDFLRSLEKISGVELDWFYQYWVYSTKPLDYAIEEAEPRKGGLLLKLARQAPMPMPVRLELKLKSGVVYRYYIPTFSQQAAPQEEGWRVLPSWAWTHAEYEVFLEDADGSEVEYVQIDPLSLSADIDRKNNIYPREPEDEPEPKPDSE